MLLEMSLDHQLQYALLGMILADHELQWIVFLLEMILVDQHVEKLVLNFV